VKTTYRLEITAVCPLDKKADVYRCEVQASRTILVEDILAAVKTATKRPAYQEEICTDLHRELACRVILIGLHSGVETEVVCG
jgi:hypothetical protein